MHEATIHKAAVRGELERLREGTPGVAGALAASADGLVLAVDAPGLEPDGFAALTAAAVAVGVRLTEAARQGDFRELLVRGEDGAVALYAAGPDCVLTVLAAPATDPTELAGLHARARACATRIADQLAPGSPTPA